MYLITAVVAGCPDIWRLSQRKVYLDQEHYKRDILCVRVFPDARKAETVRKLTFFCVVYWMGVNVQLWTEGGRERLSLYIEHRTCAADSRWCEMERQHLGLAFAIGATVGGVCCFNYSNIVFN